MRDWPLDVPNLSEDCPDCGGVGAIVVASGPRYAPCHCARDRRMAERLAAAGIPDRFAAYTFDGYRAMPGADLQWADVCEYWTPAAGSLLIWGEASRGKTSLGVGALTQAIRAGHDGWFTTAPGLIGEMKARFDLAYGGMRPSAIIDRAMTAPILLLDDLGSETIPKDSGWLTETLLRVIGARHDWLRPTIVTTNLGITTGQPFTELEDRVGPRVTWRLREMCGANVIRVGGGNQRRGGRP